LVALRLQARGLKSAAALALSNNALLARLDARVSSASAGSATALVDAAQMADWAKQVVALTRELGVYKNQCAHHYEAWIRVTQLLQVGTGERRDAGRDPGDCHRGSSGHLSPAQEREGELLLANNTLQIERDQWAHSQKTTKVHGASCDHCCQTGAPVPLLYWCAAWTCCSPFLFQDLLDQLQAELTKSTEKERVLHAECKELRATLQVRASAQAGTVICCPNRQHAAEALSRSHTLSRARSYLSLSHT
jgi:hypothetical protein